MRTFEFDALAQAFSRLGLPLVRPIRQSALDSAGVSLRMSDLLPMARVGLVVGNAGGDFFRSFQASANRGGTDPLDDFTREIVTSAADAEFGRGQYAAVFPFEKQSVWPFQTIGRASGLPAGGPLGLQIHPEFGPWWAYRAFIVIADEVRGDPGPLGDSPCADCAAPCVSACPVGAPSRSGFGVPACASHRLVDAACATGCNARSACPVGASYRYPAEQLAFHMTASMRFLRRYASGDRA